MIDLAKSLDLAYLSFGRLAREAEHNPTATGIVTCMAFNKAGCLNSAFIEPPKCPSHITRSSAKLVPEK